MPKKNVLERYQLLTNGAMASSITSNVTSIKYLDNVMIELISTGSPAGTYAIQISGDYQIDNNGNVLNPGNWVSLDLNPVPTISGAGVVLIDANQLSGPYLRCTWTPTSGSGVLNIFITAKQV
jgi:hypothetical protein